MRNSDKPSRDIEKLTRKTIRKNRGMKKMQSY